jgi:hypothetical protein
MGPTKQPAEGGPAIRLIEQVVEAFPQGRDGGAGRKVGVEKRSCPEPGFGHAPAGKGDHVRGNVDTEHVVSGIGEPLCQQAAAASKVNDQPADNAVLLQELQHTWSGLHRKAPKAHVMDVRKILVIRCGPHVTGTRRSATRHRQPTEWNRCAIGSVQCRPLVGRHSTISILSRRKNDTPGYEVLNHFSLHVFWVAQMQIRASAEVTRGVNRDLARSFTTVNGGGLGKK